jgi:hypothetical protein
VNEELTLAEVEQRAQAARLAMRADRLEMVRRLLADALRPLGRMDAGAMRTVEPAVTFDATGGSGDGRR